MTEPRHPSRFAEEPAWSAPGDHTAYVTVLLPYARGAQRAILERAATRRYYSDCTEDEQAVVLAVAAQATAAGAKLD